MSREGDWKIIRGCPGLLTDWYNLSNYNPDSSPVDAGIELALTNDPSAGCLDPARPVNSTFFYFLFNIKGIYAHCQILNHHSIRRFNDNNE